MFGLSFLQTGSTTLGTSHLIVRDALGTQLNSDVNSGASGNSLLSFTPANSGTFFLDVSEFFFAGVTDPHTGEYSLFGANPAGPP